MTAVCHTDYPLLIYDEISTQLTTVTLNSAPPSTLEHQLGICEPGPEVPGSDKRGFKTKGMVDVPLRIDQELKCSLGFHDPFLGQSGSSKGDDRYPGSARFQIDFV